MPQSAIFYGPTVVDTDVSFVDEVKPAGVVRKTVVDPWVSGKNWATPVPEPAAMVTGEAIVPTPGLLLLRDTCNGAAPPRNDWVAE